jgi:hypothetical protein
MSERRFRVLAIASHPVQYAAPIFRLMAQHPQLDFQVAYCSMRGAEAAHDPEFGRSVTWDIPLLAWSASAVSAQPQFSQMCIGSFSTISSACWKRSFTAVETPLQRSPRIPRPAEIL